MRTSPTRPTAPPWKPTAISCCGSATRESKLIKKIKQALERIENGTYGICESCGEEISVKRLKARPVTTQCIECKAKEEALEKALGI